jgi:hypothetical protein
VGGRAGAALGRFHGLLLWLPRASYPELRRLAVAAQAGPGFALAFRPPEAGCEASPAVLRIALESLEGQLGIRIPQAAGLASGAAPFASDQKAGLPVLWVALHFPQLRRQALARGHAPPEPEREALAAVAAWACQFTPRVSLEPPQGIVAEVAGSLRFFGGLEP